MGESFFKWDQQKLTTHVDAMDREHQKLIDIMNRLYERHEAKATKPELQSIVRELVSWTVTHFEHEEKFFDTLAYSQASVHKKIHKDLIARLKEHGGEFEKTGVLTPAFFQFLKTWLTAHIMGIDTKYGLIASQKAG
ncbi:bacteriohemerythrin [Bdellovibrio svalbardensis]|uniref:Bacteriohemerythrin n=1 Tax=Bdellovibrio svalbardensis TaxID=2972972 RepID=A0ABT6DEI3_9BACT|nr:bacteriohemerythrin [Bdellovibrio svalbardensis]MDG0815249.1 bacteriohemerythrin [Bdellovibrio svalbardensis]